MKLIKKVYKHVGSWRMWVRLIFLILVVLPLMLIVYIGERCEGLIDTLDRVIPEFRSDKEV